MFTLAWSATPKPLLRRKTKWLGIWTFFGLVEDVEVSHSLVKTWPWLGSTGSGTSEKNSTDILLSVLLGLGFLSNTIFWITIFCFYRKLIFQQTVLKKSNFFHPVNKLMVLALEHLFHNSGQSRCQSRYTKEWGRKVGLLERLHVLFCLQQAF